MTIQELGNRFKEEPNEKNYAQLDKAIRPRLQWYILKHTKDPDLTQDILTDALVLIWRKIHLYDDKWAFSTWCYTIAKNHMIQQIRKRNKSTSLDNIIERSGVEPIEHITGYDHTQMLYDMTIEAIYRMPDTYREALILREIDGLKYIDIAAKMGLNENTVKSKIKMGRDWLRQELQYDRLIKTLDEDPFA